MNRGVFPDGTFRIIQLTQRKKMPACAETNSFFGGAGTLLVDFLARICGSRTLWPFLQKQRNYVVVGPFFATIWFGFWARIWNQI